MSKLGEKHDIILVQEHWLLPQQFHLLDNMLKHFNSHCVSSMKDATVLHGRPYGGCAVLWDKNIKASIIPITTDSCRICAVKMVTENASILICSVYMPDIHASAEEFKNTTLELSAILRSADFDGVVIGGDLNVSMSRNSKNSKILSEFIAGETLKCGLLHMTSKIIYTFESKCSGHRSLIDHFLLSENLFDSIMCYNALSDIDNMSDHLPVSMQLDVNLEIKKDNYIPMLIGKS